MTKEGAATTMPARTLRGVLGAQWIMLLFFVAFREEPQFAHAFVPLPKIQQHKFIREFDIDSRFQLFAAPQKAPHTTTKNNTVHGNKESGKSNNTNVISHLANDANLSSLTKNNPTWDQNIAALLEYKEIYGTVNLPRSSKEYPNLGKWVKNLREMEGRLTQEQKQKLNDIGFTWKDSSKDKQDKQWHEMFLRLKAYKEEHGDCLVPVRNYPPDQKLANWVRLQRQTYNKGKMKPKRKEMLDSIGFVWRLREFSERDCPEYEELWEKRYQELIEFKEEHNHTNVPRDYPQNIPLGIWVNNQRTRKRDGTLRKDRITWLDKIGFVWEFDPIWEESWLEQYEEFKTYYQELASYKKTMKNNPEGNEAATRPVLSLRLHSWAAKQRTVHAKGDLEPHRKGMLDDIGFDWWE